MAESGFTVFGNTFCHAFSTGSEASQAYSVTLPL